MAIIIFNSIIKWYFGNVFFDVATIAVGIIKQLLNFHNT